LPQLLLLPALPSELDGLAHLFPKAKIEVVGDPRWDRVHERGQRQSQRAEELIERFKNFKKPWGMIGNAWMSDLKMFEPQFHQAVGTLWIVPHRIEPEKILEMKKFLTECDFNPILSQELTQNSKGILEKKTCILVNEMGLLAELYSVADWAFVGGGFGAGVHSTIEPGIYGIPIGCGPKGASQFTEIPVLQRSGQLTLIKNSADLEKWLITLNQRSDSKLDFKRKHWTLEAQSRLGATQKIMTLLENFVG
jgi:3-deoxy-D-manno-octulosonic-acid transferase